VVLVAGRKAPVPANTLEPLVQPVIYLFIYFPQAGAFGAACLARKHLCRGGRVREMAECAREGVGAVLPSVSEACIAVSAPAPAAEFLRTRALTHTHAHAHAHASLSLSLSPYTHTLTHTYT
jgi:hypothetical protein